MIYSVGERVLVKLKIVQKVENKDGVSYDVTPDDPKREYCMLRVTDEDIRTAY